MTASSQLVNLLDHDEWLRRQSYSDELLQPIYQTLEQVRDPEIPALSIWDMGILRTVEWQGDTLKVVVTPTYSGCPAMDIIRQDIVTALEQANYQPVEIETRLSPVWTTSWMADDAKQKMAASGIAPPQEGVIDAEPQCPLCGSEHTERISEFGSTACKAMYRCTSCLEPFDYFKAY
jgi:ring-1,2-phenylacetyl-CoA epoxidase subunit PaaD